MPITRHTLRLIRDLRATVGTLADTTVRDLTTAWVAAWDRISPDWQAAITDLVTWAEATGRWPNQREIAQHGSVRQALGAAAVELDALAAATTTSVTNGAAVTVAATAAAEPAIIASQVPSAAQAAFAAQAAAVILPSALDAITTRVQQAIVTQTRPLSGEAQAAMRHELIRGIRVGANPMVVARRMVERVNGQFEGGLVRATVIARTELLDSYRTASRYAHAANADVLEGWTWLATVTGPSARRTCSSCWAMHGTVHALSESGPDDHQQGRCSRAPRVKPWSDLGFDHTEPADATPDARELFDALSDADQVAIMGADRLALLRSGRITWDDIPMARDNPGWRRSYTPRPVADLRRIADRRGN
ncbi:hypothetical protein AB0B94_30630 [Micromonospora sp. NPDC048986]|uniref:hypothetical protein n=1 Tax=Micromonospora sp. NPDC048986 TaxID=3155644 RepID=UPI0033C2D099